MAKQNFPKTSLNLLLHSAAKELPTNVGSSDDVVKDLHCSKTWKLSPEQDQ